MEMRGFEPRSHLLHNNLKKAVLLVTMPQRHRRLWIVYHQVRRQSLISNYLLPSPGELPAYSDGFVTPLGRSSDRCQLLKENASYYAFVDDRILKHPRIIYP